MGELLIVKQCPRCKENYYTPYDAHYVNGESPPFPALSRSDNETYICSSCGMIEALKELGLSTSD